MLCNLWIDPSVNVSVRVDTGAKYVPFTVNLGDGPQKLELHLGAKELENLVDEAQRGLDELRAYEVGLARDVLL